MLKPTSAVALTFATGLAEYNQGRAETQSAPHHGMESSGARMGTDELQLSGIGMAGRQEGRVAFVRAELPVTAAQSRAWDTIAITLRNNAHLLEGAGMTMGADSPEPQLLEQLDSQVKVLTARIEEIRAMKAQLTALYDILTPDQRKRADEFLARHTGRAPERMKQAAMIPMQPQIQQLAGVARLREQSRDLGGRFAWREAAANQVAVLTPRQRQIMELVLAGHPSKNIAADIGISQRTVENHRASIMKRTGSKSLPALARLAFAASWNDTGQLSVQPESTQ